MQMPVMDGEAFVRELRKNAPDVPVICISGLELESQWTRLAELRPQAFLTKPYTSEKLLTTLHEVITRR